jgi:hypothetical protein
LQVLAIANKHNHSKVLLFLLYTQLLAKNSNLAKDCKIDKAKLFSQAITFQIFVQYLSTNQRIFAKNLPKTCQKYVCDRPITTPKATLAKK